jgi:hypothetical protein
LQQSHLPGHRSEKLVPRNSAKISGKPEMIRESPNGTGSCRGYTGNQLEIKEADDSGME